MLPKTLDINNPEAVYRFIGGRRRYNAFRKFSAFFRRKEVARLLLDGKSQSEIARELDVSRSCISKDVKWLRNKTNENSQCPCCGHNR